MYFVKCKCLWACPKLKLLPQRFENENVYINEMYLINEFDRWLRSGVPGDPVRTRQLGQTGLGGRYGAQKIIHRWSPFNRGDSPAAHMH